VTTACSQVASKAPKLVQRTATGTVHAVDDEAGGQFLEIREPYDETTAAAAAAAAAAAPLQAVAEEEEEEDARASMDDADADALLARLEQLELDEEAEGSDDSDDEDEVCVSFCSSCPWCKAATGWGREGVRRGRRR